MKHFAIFIVLCAALALVPVSSQAMEVMDGVVTTGIQDRQPVDKVETAPASVGKLFCFTRIAGAPEGARVFHVWYQGDREMARVELLVRSSNWRTWSSKTLLPDWTGDWRVVVVDDQGQVLLTLPFNLN